MNHCSFSRNLYYGTDALQQLPVLCSSYKKIAVLSDRGIVSSGTIDPVLNVLKQAKIDYVLFSDIPSEPTYEQAQHLVDSFLASGAEMILAVGGGSVMDVAKLCSVAAGTTVAELLEKPSLAKKTVYTIMVPTTAGTGAEATPNAIVAVPEKELKVGIVSDEMIPDAVVLDESLLRHLPTHIAASTGIDALCHAVECYTSLKATPLSDMFALEAARLIFQNIEAACLHPEDRESVSAMQLGAYYAGMAIACSGTTAVHALSYPLGGKYHIPHGVANAMMLLPVMQYNLPECIDRFAAIYDALGEHELTDRQAKAEWLVNRMAHLVEVLQIPTDLKKYGVQPDDLEVLVQAGMSVTRLLNNNRRKVTEDAARMIYQTLLS